MIYEKRQFTSVMLSCFVMLILSACGGESQKSDATSQYSAAPHAPAPTIERRTFSASDNRGAYKITKNANGTLLLTNERTSTTIEAPANVQVLRFWDMSVNLTIATTAKKIPQASLDSLIELYIAYFGRVPDADGLEYWIKEMMLGKTIEEIGLSFYSAAVTHSSLTGYSQTMSHTEFVTKIYQNVLLRRPDPAGLDYWVKDLSSGVQTRGALIRAMLIAAKTISRSEPFGWSGDLLEKRIEFAKFFAIEQGLTYNTTEETIRKTMSMAAAIYPSDSLTALLILGEVDWNFLSPSLSSVDVPPIDKTYAYVVGDQVLNAMPDLIAQFQLVSCNMSCKKTVLIRASDNPGSIRNQLTNIPNLEMVFLIGEVPKMIDQDTNSADDTYYRSLNAKFDTPVLRPDGNYYVMWPGEMSLDIRYARPTNAASRITGGLKGLAEIDYVRTYLQKNIRGRDIRGIPKFSYIETVSDTIFDTAAYLNAFLLNSLYAKNQVDATFKVPALQAKAKIFDCLTSGSERCDIEAHGSSSGLLIEGASPADAVSVRTSDITSLNIKSKFINFTSCSVGDFLAPGFFAGAVLNTGETLFVRAYTTTIFVGSDTQSIDVYERDHALGVGRTMASTYTVAPESNATHYFGDPTIRMRTPDLNKPRPKLLVQNKRYHQEFKEKLYFEDSVNGEGVKKTVILKNDGDADLALNGSLFGKIGSVEENIPLEQSCYYGVTLVNRPREATFRGNFQIIVPSKRSVSLQYLFKPYKDKQRTFKGTCSAYFSFATNDPEIGAFGVELIGVAR